MNTFYELFEIPDKSNFLALFDTQQSIAASKVTVRWALYLWDKMKCNSIISISASKRNGGRLMNFTSYTTKRQDSMSDNTWRKYTQESSSLVSSF
jgi:hypothetical protein